MKGGYLGEPSGAAATWPAGRVTATRRAQSCYNVSSTPSGGLVVFLTSTCQAGVAVLEI